MGLCVDAIGCGPRNTIRAHGMRENRCTRGREAGHRLKPRVHESAHDVDELGILDKGPNKHPAKPIGKRTDEHGDGPDQSDAHKGLQVTETLC